MIVRVPAALLGVLLLATGLTQLFAPLRFYETVPGVIATGPFNAHLMRDVGAAFLTASAGVLAFAWRPVAARPALLAAACFLVLHAAVHVFDAVCGVHPLADTLRDFAGVHLTALLVLALALAPTPQPSRP